MHDAISLAGTGAGPTVFADLSEQVRMVLEERSILAAFATIGAVGGNSNSRSLIYTAGTNTSMALFRSGAMQANSLTFNIASGS